jgi:hypothetical protein
VSITLRDQASKSVHPVVLASAARELVVPGQRRASHRVGEFHRAGEAASEQTLSQSVISVGFLAVFFLFARL